MKKKNSPSGNIFVHFILCQREKKRHWIVHRAWLCVIRFRAVDHFILGGRRPWVSKHRSDYVRGKICFKEIVLNTKLDLNHPSFMHLVYEFVYHIYLCYCLYLNLYVFLLLNHKVNCWYISNNLSTDLKTYRSKYKQ